MKNDPAHLVPKALGGAKATGHLVGKTKSAVHRWALPKTKGGAEGRVPASNIFPIWCALIERGSDLSLEDVVFTAEERAVIAELRLRTRSLASPETIGDET